MKISQEDLDELEFPALLQQISPFAYSEKVAAAIESLRPLEKEEIASALQRVSEYLTAIQSHNILPFQEYEDIEEELRVIGIENYRLDNVSFLKIKAITEQVGRLAKFFRNLSETFPLLNFDVEKLIFHKEIIEKIDAVFNRFGEVKNDASPALRQIRQEMQHARKAIDENFRRSLAKYADFLEDIRETIIDNHRVLAVKSGFKKRVSGRTLGISKTGSITYIQPESVLNHSFRLAETLEEEKKETDRLLRHLTAELAVFAEDLQQYQQYIFALDAIRSKALFAEKINGILPKINAHNTLRLREAYHPLLWLQNQRENKQIYSQTLTVTEHNRMICISGPNAGGKSITLKTVGLLQLMIQSGILIPAHPKSEIFFFDKILTDIGDNQSIENHLSTYSSRLKKMAGMIQEADANSLLLIDEFGTGSDPGLGGALAESFLEYFYEKKSFGIITTHYMNIKILVEKLPNATNAAMLFDEKTLQPMYKLEVGQAGSSFTFEVAEKNRIPKFIIANARKKMEKDVMNLDKTIVKLQQEKFEVEKLKSGLSQERESAAEKKDNLQKLNDQLEQKLFNFQKLYEEEHRKLQFGSKVESFINAYVNGKPRKELTRDFVKLLELEKHRSLKTDKDTSKRMQVIRRKITQQLKKTETQEKIAETNERLEQQVEKERAVWIKVGQRVRINGSTSVGSITEVQKNGKVTVSYGNFKTTIHSKELERI